VIFEVFSAIDFKAQVEPLLDKVRAVRLPEQRHYRITGRLDRLKARHRRILWKPL
jgi:hypothetical protein